MPGGGILAFFPFASAHASDLITQQAAWSIFHNSRKGQVISGNEGSQNLFPTEMHHNGTLYYETEVAFLCISHSEIQPVEQL